MKRLRGFRSVGSRLKKAVEGREHFWGRACRFEVISPDLAIRLTFRFFSFSLVRVELKHGLIGATDQLSGLSKHRGLPFYQPPPSQEEKVFPGVFNKTCANCHVPIGFESVHHQHRSTRHPPGTHPAFRKRIHYLMQASSHGVASMSRHHRSRQLICPYRWAGMWAGSNRGYACILAWHVSVNKACKSCHHVDLGGPSHRISPGLVSGHVACFPGVFQ